MPLVLLVVAAAPVRHTDTHVRRHTHLNEEFLSLVIKLTVGVKVCSFEV